MSFEAVAPASGVANVFMRPWCDGCAPQEHGASAPNARLQESAKTSVARLGSVVTPAVST